MLNSVGYFIHTCDLFLTKFVPVDTQNNVNHNAAMIAEHDLGRKLGASSMSTSTTIRAPHNTYTIHEHKLHFVARDELQQYAAAVNSAPCRRRACNSAPLSRRAASLRLKFLFTFLAESPFSPHCP